MNTHNIQLGRIAGIPVDLDRSWFLIFALLTWLLAADFYPSMYPAWSPALHWTLGAVTALGLFGSVLLHELGHSIVALWYRIPVHGITLFLFGGVARLGAEPPGARAEFLIAIAGPLVSFALAVFFWLLLFVTADSELLYGLTLYLLYMNLTLCLFNLIPGYPLDGGRVLRAVVWAFNHDLRRATVFAAHAGQLFAFVFIGWGVWRAVSGNLSGGIWMALIGWFLYTMATQAVSAYGRAS